MDDEKGLTLQARVFQTIATSSTPLQPADVMARLPFEPQSIRKAFARLRDLGAIRFAEGSRLLSELVPGATIPRDTRGRPRGSSKRLNSRRMTVRRQRARKG